MYCPRCSHQQTSDSARYCTKCGFQISAVKELVANDGVPVNPVQPTPIQIVEDNGRRPRRSRIVNIILLIVALSMLSRLHNGAEVNPGTIIGAIVIAILFTRIVVRFFSRSTKDHKATLIEPRVTPVQQQEPKRIVTAEMAPVPSVTERTTKLLANQPQNFEQDYR